MAKNSRRTEAKELEASGAHHVKARALKGDDGKALRSPRAYQAVCKDCSWTGVDTGLTAAGVEKEALEHVRQTSSNTAPTISVAS
jgi:hypothetical protein